MNYRRTKYPILLLSICIITSLICLTIRRNSVFRTPVALWADNAAKSPGKQRIHFNYACVLSRAGFHEQALAELSLSLSLPDSFGFQKKDAYIESGNALYFLKRYDEALAAWRQALLLSPVDPEILNNMAMALLKKGNLTEALSHAELSLARTPEGQQPEVLLTIAEIYGRKKDFKKTNSLIEQALAFAPAKPSVYLGAAELYSELGMRENALRYAGMYLLHGQDEDERNKAYLLMQRNGEDLSRKGGKHP